MILNHKSSSHSCALSDPFWASFCYSFYLLISQCLWYFLLYSSSLCISHHPTLITSWHISSHVSEPLGTSLCLVSLYIPHNQAWPPTPWRVRSGMAHPMSCINNLYFVIIYFKDLATYFQRERGREEEREGEKRPCVRDRYIIWLPLATPLTRDLACNPGMCPDQVLNQRTFWFAGRHSIHWATSARANHIF